MRAYGWFLLACLLVAPARAQQPVEVDVELIIAVDVSRSMSPRELEIQRRGYAEALASDEVVGAIRDGPLGQVALAYLEWAGSGLQRVIVDWTLIRDRAGAKAFAARLTTQFDRSMRRTSISGAIAFAAPMFEDNGFRGLRRVIDISGDGPNNDGGPVTLARDAAVAKGIVINGLPLMTREGMGARWHLDDLDRYYVDCVTGGPGAFVIPVLEWDHFPQAVRRKLVLELAGRTPRPAEPTVVPANFHGQPPTYDCFIGEKIMRRIEREMD
ncbi:MAG TPA: DUF1194 domain-containing protein [Thermohalobaculum sp.]|nr:DUF1194 domain-containing protein [Thermohalobaculum sp.]